MDDAPLPSNARQPRIGIDNATVLFGCLLLYLLVVSCLPLARLALEALRPGAHGEPFGVLIEQWAALATRRALANTVEASLLASFVSIAIGGLVAIALTLTDLRMKSALAFLILLPLLIPSQITALAWIELVGPSSPILQPLGLAPEPGTTNPLYSMGGIVLVMGVEHAALVFLTLRGGLIRVPRDLVEAARLGGARPLKVLVAVILPLARPSLVAGGALSFVSAIGNFGVPALLGIPGRVPMLTTLIYQRLQGFGPRVLGEVAAIAIILAILAAFALTASRWFAREIKGGVEGTIAPTEPFALRFWRLPVEILLWGGLFVTSVLPLVALIVGSLVPAVGVRFGLDTLTLANYRFALIEQDAVLRALRNSIGLAAVAAFISAVVAVPIAYGVVLGRSRMARLLETIGEAPYAIPGTVLAIAIILVFLPPLPFVGASLYGTIWILLVAYLARFLALAIRPSIAGMALVERAVDEAGRLAGAGLIRRLVFIIAPLVAPSVVAGALLIFMSALNELTVSALLWSTGNETLGVEIFFLHYEGNTPAASAVATLAIAVTIALAGAVSLLGRNLPEGLVPWRA
ncbi:MAG TPA: iron ABC transporter permease [Beijerinckiaceae bacterium]|nr:iron ABC transporter permease [Beijerinckiaceae bacterium]